MVKEEKYGDKTTVDGNTYIIEIEQKEFHKEKFGRKASLVSGIFGILLSVILGITIVGLFLRFHCFFFR